MSAHDVTIVIFAHEEGHELHRSLVSTKRAIEALPGESNNDILILRRGDHAPTAEWLDQHCPYPIVRLKHDSLGIARNAAADCCQSRFVALLDGGDIWSANFLAEALAQAKALAVEEQERTVWRPAATLRYADNYFDASNYKLLVTPPADETTPAALLAENPYPSSAFLSSALLREVPFPVEDAKRGWGHVDWWWSANLAGRGAVQHPVPRTLVYQRTEQVSRRERLDQGMVLGPTLLELPGGMARRREPATATGSRDAAATSRASAEG